jgi:hypothetical protein
VPAGMQHAIPRKIKLCSDTTGLIVNCMARQDVGCSLVSLLLMYRSSSPKSLRTLVRKGGLEPPRFYPPDPKSGASANSATFAFRVNALQRRSCIAFQQDGCSASSSILYDGSKLPQHLGCRLPSSPNNSRACNDGNATVVRDTSLLHCRFKTIRRERPTTRSRSSAQTLTELRREAAEVAVAVGMEAQSDGVAPKISEDELRQRVLTMQWTPAYPSLL